MPRHRSPEVEARYRARAAANLAEQIAQQIGAFMRALPAERTGWDPPQPFDDLTYQLGRISNALLDYAA